MLHCLAPHPDNEVPLTSLTKPDQAILKTLKRDIVSKVYGAPQTERCLFISRAGVCKAQRGGLAAAKSEERKCRLGGLEVGEYRGEMRIWEFSFLDILEKWRRIFQLEFCESLSYIF